MYQKKENLCQSHLSILQKQNQQISLQNEINTLMSAEARVLNQLIVEYAASVCTSLGNSVPLPTLPPGRYVINVNYI
jgi:ribosomal protein L2